jgi:hypothetical protein
VRMTSRPTASQLASQAVTDKAVTSGKVSAAQVAQITFDAIRDGQFYIYSHPQALGGVQAQMEAILTQQNPLDPYAATPQVGELLRRSMQAAAD